MYLEKIFCSLISFAPQRNLFYCVQISRIRFITFKQIDFWSKYNVFLCFCFCSATCTVFPPTLRRHLLVFLYDCITDNIDGRLKKNQAVKISKSKRTTQERRQPLFQCALQSVVETWKRRVVGPCIHRWKTAICSNTRFEIEGARVWCKTWALWDSVENYPSQTGGLSNFKCSR